MASVDELGIGGGLPHSLAFKLGSIPNITFAAAGSTQADAAATNGANWLIVTTATASQGVVLPAARSQYITAILNSSGQTIKVYGNAANAEKINNITSATGVTVTNGKACILLPALNAWLAVIV